MEVWEEKTQNHSLLIFLAKGLNKKFIFRDGGVNNERK